MKILSLFSGIGAFEKALTNMGVNYELVNYCEIDKYASKSYAAIHGVPESKNLGDITKVDTSKLPDDIDILTYGFPCQDISLAGKQRGFTNEDGERTRSGLFFEALRLIEDLQPKFAICENVKNLTSKKFANEFQIVLESLEEAGYKNYWQVLNAKDYGVPQNRERVFIISIRDDIDNGYKFPEPFPLELRLKDLLDDEVDEKYYLSTDKLTSIYNWKAQQRPLTQVLGNESVCRTLTARGAGEYHSGMILYDEHLENTTNVEDKVIKVGNTSPSGKSQCNDVYDESGLHPTLCAGTHGNCNSSVLVREATKQGYTEAYEGDSINLEQPNSKTRRGRVGRGVAQTLTTSPQQGVVEPVAAAMRGRYNSDGDLEQRVEISNREYGNALTTAQKDSMVCDTSLRIRKLTPLECFRLMGFSDDDFYKAEKVNSNTQLYKQGGNSIVVDVIEEIYEQLFDMYWDEVR